MTTYVAAFSGLVLAAGLSAVATTPAHGVDQSVARVLGGDPCNHSAPKPSNPVAAPLRIGSFNIQARRSVSDFSAGVRALLPHVDVAGLQETNSKDKAQVLANLADSGWSFYRQYRDNIMSHPLQGGAEQQPVLWRSDRFVCTYAGPALQSGVYLLKGEKPTYGDMRHWFTVVHLVDRLSGERIALINCHLVQGAVMGGRRVPGLPRHWHLFVTQLQRVVAAAQRQEGYGNVFVLGDFNSGWVQDAQHRRRHLPIRSFRAIGFRSMWATEHPPKGQGSRGGGLIDQVWNTKKAKTRQGAVRAEPVLRPQAGRGPLPPRRGVALTGPERGHEARRRHSMAGQASMTMGTPAAVARRNASSSTTPSWNHTARAPIATAWSANSPAASERRKTSTTSIGNGTAARVGYPRSPSTWWSPSAKRGWIGTIRLPRRWRSAAMLYAVRPVSPERPTTAQVSRSSSIRSTHAVRCQSRMQRA